MSIILSAHGTKAYKKYLLPAVDNAEHSIVLSKETFCLKDDVEIVLEVIEGKWQFKESGEYSIQNSITGEVYFGKTIKDEDILTLALEHQEKLTLLMTETESPLQVYSKYNIISDYIVIGKSETNDIQYDARGIISKEHAIIRRDGARFILEDLSSNGIFVNDSRVDKSKALAFGDCINVYGLNIVYLNGVIAVNTGEPNVKVVGKNLQPCVSGSVEINRDEESKEKKILYHRSPRHIYKMEDEVVEIEAPPQPKQTTRKPLAMVLGPTFSMSLPMLFGCMLMIYSYRSTGTSRGVMMYTGIITAVSSAIISAVWTIVNLHYDKKRSIEEELNRFDAYHVYLVKCANSIKEKYERNTENLLKMYLPADECAGFDENTQSLWDRNMNHSDYLCHRIGLGDIPFQVQINIPKERFTMIEDNLAQKPSTIQESYRYLHQVPICVDLMAHHVIGIVGGEDKAGAVDIMHNLVAQIATSNCYTDVKLGFVYDEMQMRPQDWDGLKWLPHTWSESHNVRYIARNKVEAGDMLYEITNVLRIRRENSESHMSRDVTYRPYYILFVANRELLEGELITKYIFDTENNYGLTTVFLEDTYDNLPNACEYIIENSDNFCGCYGVLDDLDEHIGITPDHVTGERLEQLARTLSRIEVNESETGGDIPASLTFFDMFGVQRPQQLNVMENWRKNRTYDSMKALVGQKAGGANVYLDVHEKYHGPHGLLAGTTGSGKSETLQTYILSLAINYSPYDVGFLLIDYKGGGMANLFEGLPHIIGQISNLSGNMVRRAMVSIKSENKRRQRVFNEHGVNNINLYTRLYKNNEASIPIPHLFIVIDEFAELKREEPDFMRELISVAQVGQSLGVHLILATQKPNGTVDDNIWSNSRFRLCLRVQDRQDSNDMLHRPDAAYLTQAGRCYMQVGNDELFELFQSGWSGAVYDDSNENVQSDIAHMVSGNGKAALIGNRAKLKQKENVKRQWVAKLILVLEGVNDMDADRLARAMNDTEFAEGFLGRLYKRMESEEIDYPCSEYNSIRLKDFISIYCAAKMANPNAEGDELALQILALADLKHVKLPEKKEKTQLDAVVEYLGRVAAENNYTYKQQLWLPMLPTFLYLDELPGAEAQNMFNGGGWNERETQEWSLEVTIGMYDDPVNQAQDAFGVSLSQDGNHIIMGTIVTGKSTFLQTLIYALAMKYTPEEINIYAVDYSAKMLSAFEDMPHIGGVVYENQEERIDKLFNMLGSVLEQRKQLLKGGNYSQYVRVNGTKIPAIVVVIDNYTNFRGKTECIYDEAVMQLAREGVSYGIYLVITGDSFGAAGIPTKLAENFRTVICLEMNDKSHYGDALHTMHFDTLPEANVKGRGIAKIGEEILEFQTALAFEADDDFSRSEKLREISGKMRSAWTGRIARPIPEIPEKPEWSVFSALEEAQALAADDRHLPIGYDAKSAAPYGVDLSRIYCYMITGKARSGKTNMLKAAINSAIMRGGEVAVFDFKAELQKLAENDRVEYIDTDAKVFDYFQAILPDFKERNQAKRALVQKGMTDDEIYVKMREYKERYIFIADYADFAEHVKKPKDAGNASGFIENLLDKGALHNVYWFAVFQPDTMSKLLGSSLYTLYAKYKNGMHFGGSLAEQRIFSFEFIPYSEKNTPLKAGVGMNPDGDEATRKVVVPLVKG